jgi:alginate O-acetyltransferase complex protein AlgI
MSLGTWFRDYIYIPLGGNRVALPKWMFNTFVVWFVTGFWHGADWTFIIWGLYFFVFLVMEKFFLQKWLNKLPKFVSHIYVTVVIAISFVIFSGAGLKGMVADLSAMFGGQGLAFWSKETTYHLSGYAIALAVAIFGATPVLKNLFAKLHTNEKTCRVLNVLEPIFHIVLLLIVTAYFVDGSFSPFLYFRF